MCSCVRAARRRWVYNSYPPGPSAHLEREPRGKIAASSFQHLFHLPVSALCLVDGKSPGFPQLKGEVNRFNLPGKNEFQLNG